MSCQCTMNILESHINICPWIMFLKFTPHFMNSHIQVFGSRAVMTCKHCKIDTIHLTKQFKQVTSLSTSAQFFLKSLASSQNGICNYTYIKNLTQRFQA